MLFKEVEGKEIVDKNGQRVGFVEDIVFTTTGKVTHIIGTPKGIFGKMTIGQLNIQFEDVAAIDKVLMLNKSHEQLLGGEERKREMPAPPKPPEHAGRVLLKKKK
jgi:sporulation protein YlmC with PRC-barrel domain